eukprot:4105958-Pyramimonas_sp.AAC.2
MTLTHPLDGGERARRGGRGAHRAGGEVGVGVDVAGRRGDGGPRRGGGALHRVAVPAAGRKSRVESNRIGA